MSLKERIAQASDRAPKLVEVEEWGLTVGLRKLTLEDRNRLVLAARHLKNGGDEPDPAKVNDWALQLVVLCLVDEDGARIYESEDEGRKALLAKSAAVVDRLAEAAMEHNKLQESAVEDAQKN